MEEITMFIIGALKITLLDLTLSGDNVGVIALATRNLKREYAKKASFIGIMGAIGLRILFASIITIVLAIDWLPIKLIGGLILVKITWDFIKPSSDGDEEGIKEAKGFWNAVIIIIVADISMSLDNVLAIAAAANGSIILIVFGILVNIPIIFYGSQFVLELMNKYKIVVYIGGSILAHTSVKMIFEDPLVVNNLSLPEILPSILAYSAAILTLVYGYSSIRKEKFKINNDKKSDNNILEVTEVAIDKQKKKEK